MWILGLRPVSLRSLESSHCARPSSGAFGAEGGAAGCLAYPYYQISRVQCPLALPDALPEPTLPEHTLGDVNALVTDAAFTHGLVKAAGQAKAMCYRYAMYGCKPQRMVQQQYNNATEAAQWLSLPLLLKLLVLVLLLLLSLFQFETSKGGS